MKSITIFSVLLSALFISSTLSSQISITSNGNVGVNSETPLSKLSVNADGDQHYSAYIKNPLAGPDYGGLFVNTFVPTSGAGNNHYRSLVSAVRSGSGFAYGLVGYSENAIAQTSGRSFGVFGQAGNATSGYNYGVVGAISGSNNGSGIYGVASVSEAFGENTGGRYAGYFLGNVYLRDKLLIGTKSTSYKLNVEGDARVQSLYQYSDISLKENIKGLDSSLKLVKNLNGVKYNLKPKNNLNQVSINKDDTTNTNIKSVASDSTIYKKTRFGFIAQEFQKQFPELVKQDDEGLLSIDYIGLIPVLVEAIKEQEMTINTLKDQLTTLIDGNSTEKLKVQKNSDDDVSISEDTEPILYQNSPNPFNNSTEICFYIPSNSEDAKLLVFNMQGTLVLTKQISSKGHSNLIISSTELNSGMYLYTLLVDNKEVDTKKMILTE